MDDGPGWLPDPEGEAQERYWSGSAWTDRVRPAGRSRSMHLPEHVPELQRALAAATADIDEVEDRLSTLFERTEGAPPRAAPRHAAAPEVAGPARRRRRLPRRRRRSSRGQTESEDEVDRRHESTRSSPTRPGTTTRTFAELDAALAAEEPDEPEETGQPRRGLFRRRS